MYIYIYIYLGTPWGALESLSGREELSDIRLEILDIQEAIKNHDLWVQDQLAIHFRRNRAIP